MPIIQTVWNVYSIIKKLIIDLPDEFQIFGVRLISDSSVKRGGGLILRQTGRLNPERWSEWKSKNPYDFRKSVFNMEIWKVYMILEMTLGFWKNTRIWLSGIPFLKLFLPCKIALIKGYKTILKIILKNNLHFVN